MRRNIVEKTTGNFNAFKKELPGNLINREKFLLLALKTSAAVYLVANSAGCVSAPKAPVALKSLSDQQYENITIIGNFFLKDIPFKHFNIGQALDKYLYGAPHPHPQEAAFRELISIPSSLLAMIYIDHSFTTLTQMNDAQREEVFLRWRTSSNHLQRGIYTLMHIVCMTLISGEDVYHAHTGFIP